MVGKTFIVTWMVVWPIIALFPAFVPTESAKIRAVEVAQVDPEIPASEGVTIASDPFEVNESEATESLPDAPLFDHDNPASDVATRTTAQPVSQPRSTPVVPTPSAESSSSDLLPPAGDPADLEAMPAVPPVRSSRRLIVDVATQEEQARQLIHARALQRAHERQSRLESKYRAASGIRTATPSEKWHQQILQQNRSTGTRSSRKP